MPSASVMLLARCIAPAAEVERPGPYANPLMTRTLAVARAEAPLMGMKAGETLSAVPALSTGAVMIASNKSGPVINMA